MQHFHHIFALRRGHLSPWRWLAASIALLTLAGCGGSSGSDQTGGRAVDKVVYVKNSYPERNGDGTVKSDVSSELYRVNTDGTEKTRILETGDKVYYDSASLSADGFKLVVMSSRDNCGGIGCQYTDSGYPSPRQIWVMNSDGSRSKQLTSATIDEGIENPALSPNGSKVVCQTNDGLSVLDVSSGERKQIARGAYYYPSFSPDGSKILVSLYKDRSGFLFSELLVMNADGSGARKIADGAAESAFSPDGLRVIYTQLYADVALLNAPRPVLIVNADGTGQKQLTADRDRSFSPMFSRDGTKIVFKSASNQGDDIPVRLVTMDFDGSHQTSVPIEAN